MKAVCKMSGKEVVWPCNCASCPLFGDCLVDYEKAMAQPYTNADHIRSMTDEYLSQWLSDCCPPNDKRTSCCGEESGDPNSCKKCWMDWLKQPFK